MRYLFSKNRVETFSDGIFAIIITLLVLEIKVPHIPDHHSTSELFLALLGLLPKLISWGISFFTIAVIWTNHHKIFNQISHLDSGLFWWNTFLLFWCTFIPFPTAVMGDYPDNRSSILLYGIVMAFMALSFTMMRFYALRNKKVLIESINMEEFKRGTTRSLAFGPLAYIFGTLLGFIHPYLAFLIFAGIPIYFIFYDTKGKEALSNHSNSHS